MLLITIVIGFGKNKELLGIINAYSFA